jgi:uncharacterized protein YprB with RNaseH-like and TPR domain
MINPNTLSKKEQEIYYNQRCRHSHIYATHPACFQKEILEKGGNLKEGYLDIEAGGLKANFDYILTYVIKEKGKNKYHTGQISKKDLDDGIFDKRVCEKLIEDIQKFDIIYTYFGTLYDIPYMRSRCLYHNLVFPEFGKIMHKDLYYVVKRLFKLHRHSLETVTRFLGIEGKNHIFGDYWMRGKLGDEKALKYIMHHNKLDCDILEKLHMRLTNYFKRTFNTV